MLQDILVFVYLFELRIQRSDLLKEAVISLCWVPDSYLFMQMVLQGG